MKEPDLLVISCIPDDCLTNRAFVMSFGVLPDSVPWLLPYAGSVKGKCQRHHGPIWIGPHQQKLIEEMTQKEESPLVICHICSIAMANAMDADISLLELSSNTTINPRDN